MHHTAVPFVPFATPGGVVRSVSTADGVMIAAAVAKSYSARTRSWNCRYASTMLFYVPV